MKRVIRQYAGVSAAIAGLMALALATTYVIVQEQRLRIPILEERPFELRAEMETAQAVVSGQGQTIRVAGVRIGEVTDAELEDGHAVVTFGIDREYLPIYRDAQLLMRPQTGLKDMFFELDPGTRGAGEYEEGETIPLANTLPDVNVDDVLEVLDADSRAYLRLLVVGLGDGIEGRGGDLAQAIGDLGPITRDFAALSSELERRDGEIARLIHNLNTLSASVGRRDDELAQLIDASNAATAALAGEADDVERTVAELPGTLAAARRSFGDVTPFARRLGPALTALRPFARRLDEVSATTEELAAAATPVLARRIRPLVRAARPVADPVRRAAKRFAGAAPSLTALVGKVNRVGNMVSYNPRGAEPAGTAGRDEGYLYWLGWFTHVGTNVFTGQDAHGNYRRLYFTSDCSNLQGMLQQSPFGPVVEGIITGLGPLFAAGGECNP